MKQLILLFAVVNLQLAATAQNPNPSSTIDAEISNIMNLNNLPGVSTVVVKDGEIVWVESYGFANTDLSTLLTDTTSLMLASVSKVFTGVALLQLVEDGLIALDDPINDHLPFSVTVPGYENTPITFKMLLTHTASILDSDVMDNYYNYSGDPSITLADCVQRYLSTSGADYDALQNFLPNQPGTVYEYSNMGTALEGYLVEIISGMPFNVYCEQHIFDQLCMNNTHWFLSEYQNLNMLANPHDYVANQFEPIAHYGFADYPNGMLRSNAKDLANFMITILQEGSFNGEQLLSTSSLNNALTAQIPAIEPTQGLQFYQETFNVTSGNVTLWGHNGGELGISTEMFFDLTTNTGIAVLANAESEASPILELLFDYGLTLSTSGVGNPACNPTNSISSPKQLVSYSVYPNPTNKTVVFSTANTGSEELEIIISDLQGKQVVLAKNITQELKLDVSTLSNGIYTYCIKSATELIATGKLVINN
ncbi:MAG: serine hydrolase [Fluviicola sp.]|nr:serine hydrolase [Fluviicola sp.]